MLHETICLSDKYSFLKNEKTNPTLTAYVNTGCENSCKNRPAVLICPGGAYAFVSPREAEPAVFHFLQAGYNCFVLDYTVEATGNFPTQLREAACSVDLIKSNKEQWNLNGKLAIIGFSAGGHLAANYATMWNCPEVEEVIKSKPVDACVLSYAVLSADENNFAHGCSIKNLLGHDPSEQEKERFSLQNRVSENTPPTFLWHTADDICVPVENTLMYAAALSANKVPFEVHIYPKGEHGISTGDELCFSKNQITEDIKHTQNWINHSIEFLNKYGF